MEAKLPTAEEFLMDKGFPGHAKHGLSKSWMIEFAKLHVEAALKAAAHESQCYNKAKFPGDENWVVDIESILNSYPPEKVK